jgi:hypothetical protein
MEPYQHQELEPLREAINRRNHAQTAAGFSLKTTTAMKSPFPSD